MNFLYAFGSGFLSGQAAVIINSQINGLDPRPLDITTFVSNSLVAVPSGFVGAIINLGATRIMTFSDNIQTALVSGVIGAGLFFGYMKLRQ